MRYVAITCGILALVISANIRASVPICPESRLDPTAWAIQKLINADVVFVGQVLSTEIPAPAPSGPRNATSMTELLDLIQNPDPSRTAHFYQTASFDVKKSWKGSHGPVVVVRSHLVYGKIGIFEVGKTYLVTGYKEEDSRIFLVPSECASAYLASKSGDRISSLDKLSEDP